MDSLLLVTIYKYHFLRDYLLKISSANIYVLSIRHSTMNSSPPKDDGKPTAMPLDWFEGQPTMERSAWFAEGQSP